MIKKKDKIDKKIIFNLDIPPYDQQCIVCCNGQMKDVVKFLKRIKLGEGGKQTLEKIEKNRKDYFDIIPKNNGRLYVDFSTGYIMIIHHHDGWISTTKTVSHESNHLAQYVLRNAGIQLIQETEEAYTYLQEYILAEILKKIY